MPKKPLLIIAAVAVMLVGATSAYGDYTQEIWNGWFSWGTLTYDDYNYYYSADGGVVLDTVNDAGTYDLFYLTQQAQLVEAFVCSQLDDTIYLAVSYVDGSKPHGESGQKEVDDGGWSGSAVRRKNEVETIFSSVEGTWDTDEEDDYFDYTMCPCPPNTPTYSGKWYVTDSTPSGLTGDGGSSGYRERP